MKIAIVNSVAGISSKELATFLRDPPHTVDVFKPYKTGIVIFPDYDLVFNYGCGQHIVAKKVINTSEAVLRCIDKVESFKAFNSVKASTVEYTTRKELIPKHWAWVVVRDKIDGRKAEGLAYYENIPGNIPNGQLYTEYFEHRHEYRVVVLKEKVVGFYHKTDINGTWHFMVQPKKGFEEMGRQCVAAAKALGIDYVGFDVLAVNKNCFKIIEANSAPTLTKESMEAIYSLVYN